MKRAAVVLGLLVLLAPSTARAEPFLITFSGTLVTGGPVGTVVHGTALFPDDLPDLIPGQFEDWWQSTSFTAFTFQGNGINFSASTGSASELRIKDGDTEDALRYDGVSGDASLLLLLSGGGVNSLLPGSGGLTGEVPTLSADGSAFSPCAIAPGGTTYAGSCSQFATSAGAMLFTLTELSIQPVPAFSFKGFFSPVDNDPVVNSVKAGAGVPVKFSLGGNQGLNIFQAGFPGSQSVACDDFAMVDSVEETVSAGQSGLTYDASTDQYTYVWKTQKSWAKSCRQLVLRLTDGSFHIADFQFR